MGRLESIVGATAITAGLAVVGVVNPIVYAAGAYAGAAIGYESNNKK